jgi:hypothetical protein
MMRETLAANSREVMLAATPHNESQFQWRDNTGGGSDAIGGGVGTATLPLWMKLVRRGNTFSGF